MVCHGDYRPIWWRKNWACQCRSSKAGRWDDQQIGASIAERKIDFLVFLWGPLAPHPMILMLRRCCELPWFGTSRLRGNHASADFIIASPLVSKEYQRQPSRFRFLPWLRPQESSQHLQSLSTPNNVAGMARFGIHAKKVYGVSFPQLKQLARQVGKNHLLAQELWSSGAHEARLVACLIEDPAEVTSRQMDRWAGDFDNWAVCDGCCLHLFVKVRFAQEKAVAWCVRSREFVKRAGFSLMAVLAVHDKKANDSLFLRWLRLVKDASTDERNFVKKAVNWACARSANVICV